MRKHPTRERLVALVHGRPGISLSELRDELGVSWGTIQHHTRWLEKRGECVAHVDGRSRRFFPATSNEDDRRRIALLERPRVREVLDRVQAQPGVRQKEITDDLSISRRVLRSYVDDLSELGLLEEVHHPRARTYHTTPRLEQVLRTLPREPSFDTA